MLKVPDSAEFRRWCSTADLQDSAGIDLVQMVQPFQRRC